MELINPLAEAYVNSLSSAPDSIMEEIIRNTEAEHPHAHMMSSALQGKLLEIVSKLLNPNRILEIGTFTGLSAYCLSKGLKADGIMHTIEIREADAQRAAGYFEKAGISHLIKVHTGNAVQIISELQETWDLVFIDADKVGYIEYYELTLQRLKQGGVIIADNVLFHGQVLEDSVKGKNAKAIDAFNRHVKADNRVEQIMLTVRDGLTLIRKL